jgi:hypothetical protein
MKNIERYNLIKSVNTQINNDVPASSIPKPNIGNYSEGYIQRYFLQTRDTPGSPIFEVDNRQYTKFLAYPHYKGVSIKWRISGNINDEFINGPNGELIKNPSVVSSNRLVLLEAAKEMPDIRLHLVDPKQFWKPIK